MKQTIAILKAMEAVTKKADATRTFLKTIQYEPNTVRDTARLTVTDGVMLASVVVRIDSVPLACEAIGARLLDDRIVPLSSRDIDVEAPWPDWRKALPSDFVPFHEAAPKQFSVRGMLLLEKIWCATEGLKNRNFTLSLTSKTPKGIAMRVCQQNLYGIMPLTFIEINDEAMIEDIMTIEGIKG